MRLAIASVITKNAYVAMLLAWVHSVAQQLALDPTVQADVLLVHCDADVSTLRTMATCVHERFPTVRVRLIEGCVQAPSRLHPHFVRAVKWNTGHARFLNVWSIYHLWSLTQYETVLYMDADTLLLGPISGLLAQHEPDLQMGRVGCVQVEAREPCNSGVVLLRPDAVVFRTIGTALERIAQVGGFVLSDQDFFNAFFPDCVVKMNRTFNYANIKQGRPVPAGLHVVHFQGHRGENKPVDYRAGGSLRYTRARPEWPIFALFESHFAPLYECYTAAERARTALPLLPKAPASYAKGVVHSPGFGNLDRKAKKVIRSFKPGACRGQQPSRAGGAESDGDDGGAR